MPRTGRPGGVEIHTEQVGEGPLVVLAPHCLLHPAVFQPITADLAADHRVIRYDARGTGASTDAGPHDMQTGAGDLAAVIEAAGESAVVVCLADATNRAVRAGAERPELIEAIVVVGGLPAGRDRLEGTDAMVTFDTVVEAMLSMVENDYRGALRSLVTAGNPQMSDDELRERVRLQAEYIPQPVAATRLRAWAEDDALEFGRSCGERLHLLYAEDMGGGWFPTGRSAVALAQRLFPEAQVHEVDDGIVSRPDLAAAVVRGITADTRTPAR